MSVNADLNLRLRWSQQDALSLSNVNDSSSLNATVEMPDGVGAGQVNALWHDERELPATDEDDLDLTDLARNIFGGDVPSDFETIKLIQIVNLSTTAGDDLVIGAAPSDPFIGPLGGATDTVECPAGAPLTLAKPRDGWAVTSGAKILRIANPTANPITYQIVILGNEPTSS